MTDSHHPTDPPPVWRLDRKISLGHLITSLTVVVGLVLWGAELESRVAVAESSAPRQRLTDQRQDEDLLRLRQEIKEELTRINSKLDRYFLAGR